MKNKIKFGIIGCSSIAKRSVIPAIIEASNTELGFIGSRTKEKAEKIANEFGCEKFGSYEEVLDYDEIDAVYISVPIGLHEEWCIKSAQANKHILCEKSFSISLKSTENILNICEMNNVRVMEGLMVRFHPRTKKIHEMIENGIIGDISSFSGSYGFPPTSTEDIRYNSKLGGGVLNETGCYPICLARIIFNEEPIGVFSNLRFDEQLNVDIQGSSLLLFQNSKVGQVSFSFNSHYQANYKIWGTKGILETSRAFSIPPTLESLINIESSSGKKDIVVKAANHFAIMVEEFAEELLRNNKDKSNFEEELLKQARIMEAVRISNKENRFVFINEVK